MSSNISTDQCTHSENVAFAGSMPQVTLTSKVPISISPLEILVNTRLVGHQPKCSFTPGSLPQVAIPSEVRAPSVPVLVPRGPCLSWHSPQGASRLLLLWVAIQVYCPGCSPVPLLECLHVRLLHIPPFIVGFNSLLQNPCIFTVIIVHFSSHIVE